MKEFLINSGYKHWDREVENMGSFRFVTDKYQKRVDEETSWLGTYLCKCNDKLFIDISVVTRTVATTEYTSWTISLTHQNPVNGEWCNLEIYNLPAEKMNGVDLKKFETTLRNMWIAFNKE